VDECEPLPVAQLFAAGVQTEFVVQRVDLVGAIDQVVAAQVEFESNV